MNQNTHVKNIKVRSVAERLRWTATELIELEPMKHSWGRRFLQFDRLVRNLAVVGCMALVLIAVHNSSRPEIRSVFGAIQESTSMQWDESLGKLSFVNSLLPTEIQEVWSETESAAVFQPITGAIIHAWTPDEPYFLFQSENENVCAAEEGEVMSIAHGIHEEMILRIRHPNGMESIYGHLAECFVDVGDYVSAGELVGSVLEEQPLAFEVRKNGRSVDVMHCLTRADE